MKLLILTSAFPPEAEGAATHLPEMAAALQKNGHRVHVLAVVNRHEVRDSFPFRVKRISRSQVRFIRDLRVLAKLIREGRRSDAVYTYGIWWQATLASLITGVPLVVKFTGDKVWEQAVGDKKTNHDIEEFQQGAKSLWLDLVHSLYRFWARLSSHSIVSCDTLLRILMSWGIAREKIDVIPNSLPQNPRSEEEATYLAQWSDRSELRLITTGHIIQAKQIDGLLDLLNERTDLKLVVAGDGPDLKRVKALTKEMNLVERVLFTGKVSRQDLEGYISECDMLVLNSRIGRFNYAILEALNKRKPILATRRGLHPDFIEHGVTGWLYSNNNISELKEFIEKATEMETPYSTEEPMSLWQHQVEQTEDILKSLSR